MTDFSRFYRPKLRSFMAFVEVPIEFLDVQLPLGTPLGGGRTSKARHTMRDFFMWWQVNRTGDKCILMLVKDKTGNRSAKVGMRQAGMEAVLELLQPHGYGRPTWRRMRWVKDHIRRNPEYNHSGEMVYPNWPLPE